MSTDRQRLHSEKGIRAKIHDQRMLELRRREELRIAAEEAKVPRKPNYKTMGAPNVVMGFQLSEVLRAWVVKYLSDRPLNSLQMEEEDEFVNTGSHKRGKPIGAFMGPLAVLSERSGIHIRRVQGIVNGEFDFIYAQQAELILLAADLAPEIYYTGEIQEVPNPKWTNELWIEWMQEQGCE